MTPAPDLVRKVASKLKAALFTPSRSMEVSEKRELVSRYSQTTATDVSDAHVRDALASGIKALQRYKNKFQKLESQVADSLPASSKEHTKELLLRGFSIARAIKESHHKTDAPYGYCFTAEAIGTDARHTKKDNFGKG